MIFIQNGNGDSFVFDSLPERFYKVVLPVGMVALQPGERIDEVHRIAKLALEVLTRGNPSFAVSVSDVMGFPPNFYRAEKWPEIIKLLQDGLTA